jgi:hypothetical protein
VTLSDWLNEYREFSADDVALGVGTAPDDEDERELLAPADRVRERTPRWLDRAARIGYARTTKI